MALSTINVKAEGSGMKAVTETEKGQRVITDEAVEMGGTDAGANPLETLLGALAGCETVVANMAAKEMGIELEGLEFDIKGYFDPRGFMGEPNVCPYFQKVEITAYVATDATEQQVEELHKKANSRCPVFTMISSTKDVEVESRWIKS